VVVLRTRFVLLPPVQCDERHRCHLHDLEPDTRDITDGVTAATEPGDEHLIVLIDEVQATVIRDEGSDLLAVFDQLHTDAFPDGRVGLLRLDTNFLNHDALRVRSAGERVGLDAGERLYFI